MMERKGKKLYNLPFFIGLLTIFATVLPYLILGQDAIVTYHDQLDGELIAYRLQAKHLFDGGALPEFLGGASKTALVPPAPACVLLFLWGDGLTGLAVMQLLGSLCGYLGMYLLVKRQTKMPFLGMIMGILYGYLPFLPVYGLTQYGLPLLLFCILEAEEGKHRLLAFLYGAFFALNSSLVLAGFAVLGVMAFWMLIRYLWKKRAAALKNCLAMWLMMLGIYVIENIRLFAQMLGRGSLSHKAEYQLVPENIFSSFWNAFWQGGQHSEDFHNIFLGFTVLVAVFALIWLYRQPKVRKRADGGNLLSQLKVMGICTGCNALFAMAAALWNGDGGIFLRSHMQALGAFQMERFLWLAPCLWYLSFGCSLGILAALWKQGLKGSVGVLALCGAVTLCGTGWQVFLSGDLKPNLQKMINPDYELMSYRDYYAIGVLSQVEDFLEEREGVSKEEYRVVSLGIDPAAALYHGFYCLDGYSNNYSLDYKHMFRKAVLPELAKSEYLTDYFDHWGNRCYLFSAECPGYYTVEKGGFYFSDYEVNTQALREMGGKYLFSAAYIANAGEQGLTLLREEAFETEDSYYRIFVYQF
ncbi:MAG: DUF6044 family protein [Bacteroidales bacterium]|nr:DUF6044 family protein [Lachnoclostridium sp.]MCM1383443.1 DUF6044 family protein [Lachnoclostridium sp.]MCM1464292.1 DUF6044 family protein [Bacteroidales bacterium]